MTLEERLAEARIVFLWGEIGPATAGTLIVRLLELQDKARARDVHLYINSPGGAVDDTLAIYDAVQYLEPDVNTYCVGQATSMGALLLAAGTKGKRFALPHARIMIHQPWGGVQGAASDISIQAKEILRLKDKIEEILAKHTGKSLEKIKKDTDRDYFMAPEEAKDYGIVDEVITSIKKKKGK